MVGGGGDILAVGGWRWWMVVGGGIVQSDPTGFDSPRTFLLPGGKFSQNVTIFGVTMNSRLHIDNKKTDILILGEGPTQGLDGKTLTLFQLIFLVPVFSQTRANLPPPPAIYPVWLTL